MLQFVIIYISFQIVLTGIAGIGFMVANLIVDAIIQMAHPRNNVSTVANMITVVNARNIYQNIQVQ